MIEVKLDVCESSISDHTKTDPTDPVALCNVGNTFASASIVAVPKALVAAPNETDMLLLDIVVAVPTALVAA